MQIENKSQVIYKTMDQVIDQHLVISKKKDFIFLKTNNFNFLQRKVGQNIVLKEIEIRDLNFKHYFYIVDRNKTLKIGYSKIPNTKYYLTKSGTCGISLLEAQSGFKSLVEKISTEKTTAAVDQLFENSQSCKAYNEEQSSKMNAIKRRVNQTLSFDNPIVACLADEKNKAKFSEWNLESQAAKVLSEFNILMSNLDSGNVGFDLACEDDPDSKNLASFDKNKNPNLLGLSIDKIIPNGELVETIGHEIIFHRALTELKSASNQIDEAVVDSLQCVCSNSSTCIQSLSELNKSKIQAPTLINENSKSGSIVPIAQASAAAQADESTVVARSLSSNPQTAQNIVATQATNNISIEQALGASPAPAAAPTPTPTIESNTFTQPRVASAAESNVIGNISNQMTAAVSQLANVVGAKIPISEAQAALVNVSSGSVSSGLATTTTGGAAGTSATAITASGAMPSIEVMSKGELYQEKYGSLLGVENVAKIAGSSDASVSGGANSKITGGVSSGETVGAGGGGVRAQARQVASVGAPIAGTGNSEEVSSAAARGSVAATSGRDSSTNVTSGVKQKTSLPEFSVDRGMMYLKAASNIRGQTYNVMADWIDQKNPEFIQALDKNDIQITGVGARSKIGVLGELKKPVRNFIDDGLELKLNKTNGK